MVAGSILPITIHRNEVYFLFGKENPLEDSAEGWSDFGGRAEKDETPYQAALREGGEELTGFLGDATELKRYIRKNGGTYKINHNGYHVHMMYVEYDENLPKYFNKNHKFLWDRMDHGVLNKTKLFEKIEIGWFTEENMKTRMSEFRRFYQTLIRIFLQELPKIKSFAKNRQ